MNENAIQRDEKAIRKHLQLGAAIIGVGKSISKLLDGYDLTKKENFKMLEGESDSGRVLCHLFYVQSDFGSLQY